MRKQILFVGLMGSLLSGCQSMENILSDSGMRQNSHQDVVVSPVPRTQVPQDQNAMASKRNSNTSVIPSSPQTQQAERMPSQSKAANTQSVVPNVAPSLGE
jgi:hypothetical protein